MSKLRQSKLTGNIYYSIGKNKEVDITQDFETFISLLKDKITKLEAENKELRERERVLSDKLHEKNIKLCEICLATDGVIEKYTQLINDFNVTIQPVPKYLNMDDIEKHFEDMRSKYADLHEQGKPFRAALEKLKQKNKE